jgi:putative ATP-dependent endonuclease of the OLD family
MRDLEHLAIHVADYKCFGEEQGLGGIAPLNLIIGRNNSGKSSLLDVIEYCVQPSDKFQRLGRYGNNPKVFITKTLTESELMRVYKENTRGGEIGGDHKEYGQKLIGSIIKYLLKPDGKREFVSVIRLPEIDASPIHLASELTSHLDDPFSGMICQRLFAERDIVQESDNWPPKINGKGEGVTNAIQSFINNSTLPGELVENTMLNALNSIYEPDSQFARIKPQRVGPGADSWEIYLQERISEELIPLSQTGSGFKTILLALSFLHLLPRIDGIDVQNYIFAFEELENNLHPAMQRRLLSYIRNFAIEQGCYCFITSHSSVIIDLFSQDEAAQIIHVLHDGKSSSMQHVQTYLENRGVLEDLDVRASDLLQSNSIIWVEGPSDRVYIKKWLEIMTDGQLKEGVHYQCMFYGGRLLAHISAEAPGDETDAIAILRINRNAILVMDSDKSEAAEDINLTKQRVAYEISDIGGFSWITNGREIENYLPVRAIAEYFGRPDLPPLSEYEDIAEYLETNIGPEAKRHFEKDKVGFAVGISQRMVASDISSDGDLSDALSAVVSIIRKWNITASV